MTLVWRQARQVVGVSLLPVPLQELECRGLIILPGDGNSGGEVKQSPRKSGERKSRQPLVRFQRCSRHLEQMNSHASPD